MKRRRRARKALVSSLTTETGNASRWPDSEEGDVLAYVDSAFPGEEVLGVECVKSERVMGVPRVVWNVEVGSHRLWVITNPMNQYDQAQFPNLDIALSFHVGLTARVMEKDDHRVPRERLERFSQAWRKWQQAAESAAQADEVETFQAIGLRCRESLLAFVKEAHLIVPPSEATEPLKVGDFKNWSTQIVRAVVSGSGADQRRACLVNTAHTTWDFVSWLTHSPNAVYLDAESAITQTERVLGDLTVAILRHDFQFPTRCVRCESYRLRQIGKGVEGGPSQVFTMCEACGWQSELHEASSTPAKKLTKRAARKPAGDCVVVTVPLRGPRPKRTPTRP